MPDGLWGLLSEEDYYQLLRAEYRLAYELRAQTRVPARRDPRAPGRTPRLAGVRAGEERHGRRVRGLLGDQRYPVEGADPPGSPTPTPR